MGWNCCVGNGCGIIFGAAPYPKLLGIIDAPCAPKLTAFIDPIICCCCMGMFDIPVMGNPVDPKLASGPNPSGVINGSTGKLLLLLLLLPLTLFADVDAEDMP